MEFIKGVCLGENRLPERLGSVACRNSGATIVNSLIPVRDFDDQRKNLRRKTGLEKRILSFLFNLFSLFKTPDMVLIWL